MSTQRNKIKVSILCLAYNQKEYIIQSLDGFLFQKTNFNFEILINDDASTDGTTDIIKEYQKKYPDIIKPIFHKENQYSKGKRNFMLRYLIPNAKGKYLAVCEGDDYWTDPKKLQKQVDFLDKNKDYALCFHPVKVIYEGGVEKDSIYPLDNNSKKFTVGELLHRNYIQTNSVMYRKQNYEDTNLDVMPGDWYLHLYHAQFGKIGFINEVMSVYRKHPGGIWWQTNHDGDIDEIWKKHGIGHMVLYGELLKIYGDIPEFIDAIDNHIAGTVSALSRIDAKHKTNMLQTYTLNFMEQNKVLLESLFRIHYNDYKSLEKINIDLEVLKNKIQKISENNVKLEHDKLLIKQDKIALENEIEAIINSKTYKLGNKLAAPYRIMSKSSKRVNKHE